MVGDLTQDKVLITGGTGYLGASIGKYLSNMGYEVFLGSRKPESRGKVKNCSQILIDWSDKDLKFCKGFDLIIHAAGMNAQSSADNPKLAFQFNGLLTEKLIEKSANYGCKSFFYLSTAHVYKSPLKGLFNESSKPINAHPYASSHFYGEQALINAINYKNINGAVLRLSNCFGAPETHDNECWKLVLNDFTKSAVINKKIFIKGNYLSRRDFLPISELNRVIGLIIARPYIDCNLINISRSSSMTLFEAASLVSEIVSNTLGCEIPIIKNETDNINYKLEIQNKSLDSMDININQDLSQEIINLTDYVMKN